MFELLLVLFFVPSIILIIRDARRIDWKAVRKDISGFHFHKYCLESEGSEFVVLSCLKPNCDELFYVKIQDWTVQMKKWIEHSK